MKVLLTGGAGYIGSHTAVEVMRAGHEVTIIDNLSNSSRKVIPRIEQLANQTLTFVEADLLDPVALDDTLATGKFDAVIHFAGLKAVGESVEKPLGYYRTNLVTSINLVEAMLTHGVPNLVFSSSATVYGEPESMPLSESSPITDAPNPYARTKLMIERIFEDAASANPGLNVACLRYFNPAGAHPSGHIGEDPLGVPNNLLPFVTQVAVGRRDKLTVFGTDYPTPDGTCIRDYIHVCDLAAGHLAALEKLETDPGFVAYNLGSGRGSSVLEVIAAFEEASGQKLKVDLGARRAGDIPASFTTPDKAAEELGWRTERSLVEICRDAWNWQSRNPKGYEDEGDSE